MNALPNIIDQFHPLPVHPGFGSEFGRRSNRNHDPRCDNLLPLLEDSRNGWMNQNRNGKRAIFPRPERSLKLECLVQTIDELLQLQNSSNMILSFSWAMYVTYNGLRTANPFTPSFVG